jgi:hypothetical protein
VTNQASELGHFFPVEALVERGAETRDVRVGDWVQKGQVLAVLICAEIAKKKAELFDAALQLRLAEFILKKAEAEPENYPYIRPATGSTANENVSPTTTDGSGNGARSVTGRSSMRKEPPGTRTPRPSFDR